MNGELIGRGRTAEIFAWGDERALKLYKKGTATAQVEFEADVGRLIFAAGIPSPKVEDTIELEGQPGIVFERIKGPTMLELMMQKPWRILAFARQFAELQAQIHIHQSQELPAQTEKLKKRFEENTLLPAETKEKLLALLKSLPTDSTICHGDFHPDNIMMSPRGPIIIDWLDATCGNSLYDVARTSYLLTKSALPPGTGLSRRVLIRLLRNTFHFLYLRHYRKLKPFSRQELAQWTKIVAAIRLGEGIASEEAQLLEFVKKI
jgi:uncharacterized protein (TIGR02172 family)